MHVHRGKNFVHFFPGPGSGLPTPPPPSWPPTVYYSSDEDAVVRASQGLSGRDGKATDMAKVLGLSRSLRPPPGEGREPIPKGIQLSGIEMVLRKIAQGILRNYFQFCPKFLIPPAFWTKIQYVPILFDFFPLLQDNDFFPHETTNF